MSNEESGRLRTFDECRGIRCGVSDREEFWQTDYKSLSDAEMKEYMSWLACNRPKQYGKLMMRVSSFASDSVDITKAVRLEYCA